jgi:hypothetical protein
MLHTYRHTHIYIYLYFTIYIYLHIRYIYTHTPIHFFIDTIVWMCMLTGMYMYKPMVMSIFEYIHTVNGAGNRCSCIIVSTCTVAI